MYKSHVNLIKLGVIRVVLCFVVPLMQCLFLTLLCGLL